MRYYKAKYGVLNVIVKAENQADALAIAMKKFNFEQGAVTIVPATEKEIRIEENERNRNNLHK